MRIYPGVRFIEPDAQVPVLSSARRGVRFSDSCRRRRIVKLLLVAVAARDAMIFYPGKFSQRRRRPGPKILKWKVEADVPIKFTIGRIARITFGCAPDLSARIAIARK